MMNAALMKTAISMIGHDKISSSITELIKQVMGKKNEIKLEPGEETVTIMLYEVDQVPYYTLAFLNEDNRIIRFAETKKIDEFVNEMMKNI